MGEIVNLKKYLEEKFMAASVRLLSQFPDHMIVKIYQELKNQIK